MWFSENFLKPYEACCELPTPKRYLTCDSLPDGLGVDDAVEKVTVVGSVDIVVVGGTVDKVVVEGSNISVNKNHVISHTCVIKRILTQDTLGVQSRPATFIPWLSNASQYHLPWNKCRRIYRPLPFLGRTA